MYRFLTCRDTSACHINGPQRFWNSVLHYQYLARSQPSNAFETKNDETSIIHSPISLNLLWYTGIKMVLKLCPESICSFFPIRISCCNRSNSTSDRNGGTRDPGGGYDLPSRKEIRVAKDSCTFNENMYINPGWRNWEMSSNFKPTSRPRSKHTRPFCKCRLMHKHTRNARHGVRHGKYSWTKCNTCLHDW